MKKLNLSFLSFILLFCFVATKSMEIQTINPEIKEYIFFTCDEPSQSNWKLVDKNFYTFYTETRNKQKKYICDLIELCKNDDLCDLSEFTRYATTQGICGYHTRNLICSCFDLADTIENNKAIYHNVTKIVPSALSYSIKKKSPFALYLCVKQNSNDLFIGKSPAIIEAAKYEFYDGVLQLLGLSMGKNIDATSENGSTALMWAAINDNLQIGKLLIDAGATIDATDTDNDNYTALIWAVIWNKLQMVKLLIAAGANVDAITNHGNTALMWAANYGNPQIIKILIAANANVNITNNDGHTALFFAQGIHKGEIEKLLINASAK